MFGDLTDDEFETLDAERLQTLISSEVNTSDVISEVVFTKIVETEESQKHFDVREEKEKVLDFSEWLPDLGYGENGPVWIIHEDYDTVWGMPVIWPKGEESEYQPRSPNYGPDEEPPSNNVVVEISNNDENDMEVEFHLKRPGVQIRSDDEDEFVEEFDEASTSTGIRRESARLKSLGAVNYERYRVVVRRKTEQGKRKKTRIIEREWILEMKRDISIINKEVFETLGVVPPHYLRRGDLIAICRDEDIAELDFRHAANKALEKYMEFDSG